MGKSRKEWERVEKGGKVEKSRKEKECMFIIA